MRTSRQLSSDSKAVSVMVEYILIVGILALVMAFLVPQLSTLMSRLPTTNAMSNQFQDVASEISAQLTDMLLIAPKNGVVKSKVYMPLSIGKYTYSVEVSNGQLTVHSNVWTQKVDLGNSMLGFITKGRTFSSQPTHELVLNSSVHILPTAVAIVYPTEALVNENVTFDMTHSYGQGTLYYRWIFGDGKSTDWIKYDPLNPDTGIVHHSYSSAGNYTVTLEVKDSLGYISTDSVSVNVTEKPEVGLYVNKYVVPATITPGSTSTINIFLFGNGINQTSLNITVIHTIDASGSMNEFTPLYSFTGNVTSKSAVVEFTINDSNYDYLVFATTSDFDSFYYQYGVRPISMFVAPPNGNYVQASDVWTYNYQDGYGYVITNPQTGTWRVALNDLKPWSSESVSIYVFKGRYRGSYFDVYDTIYSNTVTAYEVYRAYGIKVPEDATALGVQLVPAQTPTNLYLWLKDNVTGEYYLSVADSNSVGWINITNPSSGYTAYIVPSLPPDSTSGFYLNTYIPKIDAAKMAAKTFDAFLRKYDYIGVVKFNWYQATYIVNPPTNDTELVNSSIDSITADGYTPMASGISYAISELDSFNNSKNSPAVDVIILLSDGNPNINLAGYYNVRQAIEDAIKEAYVAKDHGYIIYTIGYGTDANVTLLKQIASITGGEFYFAANAQELKDIYRAIARDVLTKAAENVTVTDVIPPDINVLSAPGASITKTANGTAVSWSIPVIRINQSWFGTITITTSKTGEVVTDVVNVSNVTYYNVVESRVVTVPLPVRKLNVTITKSASFELK